MGFFKETGSIEIEMGWDEFQKLLNDNIEIRSFNLFKNFSDFFSSDAKPYMGKITERDFSITTRQKFMQRNRARQMCEFEASYYQLGKNIKIDYKLKAFRKQMYLILFVPFIFMAFLFFQGINIEKAGIFPFFPLFIMVGVISLQAKYGMKALKKDIGERLGFSFQETNNDVLDR